MGASQTNIYTLMTAEMGFVREYKLSLLFNDAFHLSTCMGPKEKVNSATEYWEVLVVKLGPVAQSI